MSAAATHPTEAECDVREVLTHVWDKWSPTVVWRLGDGPLRFGELRAAVGGVSERMLTVTLRRLERDGLVERTVFPVVPPRVDYELTEMGTSLLVTVAGLFRWADDHLVAISRAREAYDARTGPPSSADGPLRRPQQGQPGRA
jgi:DNA-binding HxlR family transcriptional regulator